MNEYSNFINGEERASDDCKYPPEDTQSSTFQNIPYNPNGIDHPMEEKTLSMDGMFYNGKDSVYVKHPNRELYHFDMHNMLGLLEGISTYK